MTKQYFSLFIRKLFAEAEEEQKKVKKNSCNNDESNDGNVNAVIMLIRMLKVTVVDEDLNDCDRDD